MNVSKSFFELACYEADRELTPMQKEELSYISYQIERLNQKIEEAIEVLANIKEDITITREDLTEKEANLIESVVRQKNLAIQIRDLLINRLTAVFNK